MKNYEESPKARTPKWHIYRETLEGAHFQGERRVKLWCRATGPQAVVTGRIKKPELTIYLKRTNRDEQDEQK